MTIALPAMVAQMERIYMLERHADARPSTEARDPPTGRPAKLNATIRARSRAADLGGGRKRPRPSAAHCREPSPGRAAPAPAGLASRRRTGPRRAAPQASARTTHDSGGSRSTPSAPGVSTGSQAASTRLVPRDRPPRGISTDLPERFTAIRRLPLRARRRERFQRHRLSSVRCPVSVCKSGSGLGSC
jgi:hypothetical protein